METAEEFVRELTKQARVDKPWGYGDHDEHGVIAMVEARDAAAKLEVLADCRAWLNETGVYEHARGIADRMLVAVEAKYAAQAGGGRD
jgi:hypothetical protein